MKDLALKLNSFKSLFLVKFDTREIKRLYFISGNIVAFYLNIDVQKVYQIASDYLIDYYSSFRGDFDPDLVEHNIAEICMFRKVISIANKNLMYWFDRKDLL